MMMMMMMIMMMMIMIMIDHFVRQEYVWCLLLTV